MEMSLTCNTPFRSVTVYVHVILTDQYWPAGWLGAWPPIYWPYVMETSCSERDFVL